MRFNPWNLPPRPRHYPLSEIQPLKPTPRPRHYPLSEIQPLKPTPRPRHYPLSEIQPLKPTPSPRHYPLSEIQPLKPTPRPRHYPLSEIQPLKPTPKTPTLSAEWDSTPETYPQDPDTIRWVRFNSWNLPPRPRHYPFRWQPRFCFPCSRACLLLKANSDRWQNHLLKECNNISSVHFCTDAVVLREMMWMPVEQR